jgi:hypothetical protein
MFNETFGATGTAVTFFGGQWWMVGLFLILVFLVFLLAYRVPSEVISLYLIISFITVGAYQIFVIEEYIIQTVLLFVFILVGSIAYGWLSR